MLGLIVFSYKNRGSVHDLRTVPLSRTLWRVWPKGGPSFPLPRCVAWSVQVNFYIGSFSQCREALTESKSINYFLVYVNQSKFIFLQLHAQKKFFITCSSGPVVECWINNPKIAGSTLSETSSFIFQFLNSHNLSLTPLYTK